MIHDSELDSTFGYSRETWDAAKKEARARLVEIAKKRELIGYKELTEHIRSVGFDYHGPIFRKFLGQLSTEDDAAGKGMLTAVVVHKSDGLPGPGFFKLAKQL